MSLTVSDVSMAVFGTVSDLPSKDFTNSISFGENLKSPFMKRLNPEAFDAIVADTANVPFLTAELIESLSVGRWQDPLFLEPNWISYAFKAYFDGMIDQDQLVTLNLYDALKRESPENTRSFQLKNRDGSFNEEYFEFFLSENTFFISEEAKCAIRKQILMLKPEKTQFFNHPSARISTSSSRETLIIPPHLLQIILECTFGHLAISPIPIFGNIDAIELKNSSCRHLRIPSRYEHESLFMGNHSEPSSPIEIYHYDTSLCLYDSANPHRNHWIEIANHLEYEGKLAASHYLLNRHFPDYLYNQNFDPSINFLLSIIYTFHDLLNSTTRSYFTKSDEGRISPTEGKEAMDSILKYIQDDMIHEYDIDIHQIKCAGILTSEHFEYFRTTLLFFKNDPTLIQTIRETGGKSLLNQVVQLFKSMEGQTETLQRVLLLAHNTYDDYAKKGVNLTITFEALKNIVYKHENAHALNFMKSLDHFWSDPQIMNDIADINAYFKSLEDGHDNTQFMGFLEVYNRLQVYFKCRLNAHDAKNIFLQLLSLPNNTHLKFKFISIFQVFSSNLSLAKSLSSLMIQMHEQEYDQLLSLAFCLYRADAQVSFEYVQSIWQKCKINCTYFERLFLVSGSQIHGIEKIIKFMKDYPNDEVIHLPELNDVTEEFRNKLMYECEGLHEMLARYVLLKCGINRRHFLYIFRTLSEGRSNVPSKEYIPFKKLMLAEVIADALLNSLDDSSVTINGINFTWVQVL